MQKCCISLIITTYFVFVHLFSKPILTRQNKASKKNSQEFLASQVSVLRRNKATNSSTSNRPSFSCAEKWTVRNTGVGGSISPQDRNLQS